MAVQLARGEVGVRAKLVKGQRARSGPSKFKAVRSMPHQWERSVDTMRYPHTLRDTIKVGGQY